MFFKECIEDGDHYSSFLFLLRRTITPSSVSSFKHTLVSRTISISSLCDGTVGSCALEARVFYPWVVFVSSLTSHLWDCNSHLQPPFQHHYNHQLVLSSLSSDSAAAFIHHFSILQIHATVLLTDNQSCVSVCLANSSSFHVNCPCWILDSQTRHPVHILLEHPHKIIHFNNLCWWLNLSGKTQHCKVLVVKHWMYWRGYPTALLFLAIQYVCLFSCDTNTN